MIDRKTVRNIARQVDKGRNRMTDRKKQTDGQRQSKHELRICTIGRKTDSYEDRRIASEMHGQISNQGRESTESKGDLP